MVKLVLAFSCRTIETTPEVTDIDRINKLDTLEVPKKQQITHLHNPESTNKCATVILTKLMVKYISSWVVMERESVVLLAVAALTCMWVNVKLGERLPRMRVFSPALTSSIVRSETRTEDKMR